MKDYRDLMLKEVLPIILRASDVRNRTRDLVRRCCPKGRVVLIAIGKASASMALGALEAFSGEVEGGAIVIPEGIEVGELKGYNLEIIRGGHPLPTPGSLRAGTAVLEWAATAGRGGAHVLVLVSGGASALAESPLGSISLEDLVNVNRALLTSGASISEINTVRRHLSKVKGGGLVKAARPSEVYGLYASDVPGDAIHDIGSGPTAVDPTTFKDALSVLDFYGLIDAVPKSIVEVLEKGARGLIEETLKPDSPDAARAHNWIVARNMDVLEELERGLKERGFNVLVLTSMLQGESREVAKVLAALAAEVIRSGRPVRRPAALILGGETSVTVRGSGRGGRNQELALAWSLEAKRLGIGHDEAALLAIATDGVDGPTDAAGAVVTSAVPQELSSIGINPLRALSNNDSYEALEAIGALIKTGPTGTNLNNIIVVFVW